MWRQVVALFPFLCFDTSSWRQWALRQVAAWPGTVATAAAALRALPAVVPRALLRVFARAPPPPRVPQDARAHAGASSPSFLEPPHLSSCTRARTYQVLEVMLGAGSPAPRLVLHGRSA